MNKFLSLLVLFALTACHQIGDPITGTYSITEKDQSTPVLRVERNDGAYHIFEFHAGKWNEIQGWVKPFTAADLKEMTKEPTVVAVDGIQTNGFALFHVPAGWHSGPFTARSGYVLFTLLGPIDVDRS